MNHYDNFLNVPVEGHADFQTAVTQYEDFKVGQFFVSFRLSGKLAAAG